ncbi:MAG: (d)CMP kinase [Proteobacteria bacterium]|nr:(d)CMP kinase [Pseudomonadota bacterium]MBU1709763.1 (d)CMP kinase [Pseudomonadota bacterium]
MVEECRGPMITIDGPSGAGKSTISRMLASRLGYTYLDTGAMYRAVGLKINRLGIDLADTRAMEEMFENLDLSLAPGGVHTKVLLGQEDVSEAIRTPEMGMVASRVSAEKIVREKLTELQRQIGGRGCVVAEGRDMGTVVFPGAACKFYLDATPEERAGRRQDQLREMGQDVSFDEILAQIIKRDHDDSARALAPLKPADDAIIVDSSNMNADEVVAFMLEYVQNAKQEIHSR